MKIFRFRSSQWIKWFTIMIPRACHFSFSFEGSTVSFTIPTAFVLQFNLRSAKCNCVPSLGFFTYFTRQHLVYSLLESTRNRFYLQFTHEWVMCVPWMVSKSETGLALHDLLSGFSCFFLKQLLLNVHFFFLSPAFHHSFRFKSKNFPAFDSQL